MSEWKLDYDQKAFIMLYDRGNNKPTVIKLIESYARIMSLKYGPYDNGHIMAGLSNGIILAYSAIDLTKLYQYQLFSSPVTLITFDPTNYVIATSQYGDVAGISLIENKVKYVYVDLGKRKYCTVQMPIKQAKQSPEA